MLLPPPLFAAIRKHFVHHDCWHKARHDGQDVLRSQFRPECGARLHALSETGSGCDFLRFHRRMMRHFHWMRQTIPVPTFTFEPWPGELPAWVQQALAQSTPPFDLAACLAGIEQRIAATDVEDLGAFIEPNASYNDSVPGAGIHNRLHKVIQSVELRLYAGDETALMNDFGRAPGNVFFWTLHGWIDDIYARCQREAGEPVEQGPLEMEHEHVEC